MDNFQFYSPTEFIFFFFFESQAGEMIRKYGGTPFADIAEDADYVEIANEPEKNGNTAAVSE